MRGLIEHCDVMKLPGDMHDLLMSDVCGVVFLSFATVLLFDLASGGAVKELAYCIA